MPPKKPIPIIEHDAFSQTGEFSDSDFKTLLVANFEDAAQLHEGWTDEPLVLIGMELAQDLLHVENAKALLFGRLFKSEPKTVAAKKLWNSNAMQLKISDLDLSTFRFKDSMTSEWLDHSMVSHKFVDKNDGAEIPDDVLADLGCKGFSMKATLIPMSPEKAEVLLVAYPLPAADMAAEYACSNDHRYPGILVAREQVILGLKSASVTDSEVPTPICPVFTAQTATVDDDSAFPPTSEIVAKMAALLRNVCIPETKIDHAAVWRRWAEIKANGENNLKTTPPPILWPECAIPDPDTGEILFTLVYRHIQNRKLKSLPIAP